MNARAASYSYHRLVLFVGQVGRPRARGARGRGGRAAPRGVAVLEAALDLVVVEPAVVGQVGGVVGARGLLDERALLVELVAFEGEEGEQGEPRGRA